MRARLLALVSLALLGCIGRDLGAQGRGQDTRPGIAVLPFDNSGSYGQDKENFDALQKGIAGMLISELAANPAARVVEREEIEKLLAEQSLGASGKVRPETAAKIGKLVGARYVIAGTFIDFYGDFRLDARLVNVETSEIVKVESDRMQRDHLFDIIRTVAARLMKDTNLPPLPTSLGPADQPSDPDGGADVLFEGAPVPGSRAEGQGRGDVPAGPGRLPGVHRGAARPPAREELVT